jgi:deoxyribodipyrimidine photo-lyase
LERDKSIYEFLQGNNVDFSGSKDHVIFEKNEVLKLDSTPYTVFTPYSRKWKEKLNDYFLSSYPVEKYTQNLLKTSLTPIPSLDEMGFESEQIVDFPSKTLPTKVISTYNETRDIPSVIGTSRLSLHLRFGTISIREIAREASKLNETYLNELIWRDFYQMIIFHFPHSAKNSFKKQYDLIEWEHNEVHFKAWCEGKTGYPLVDAGMRELNATGFMHNRVRMVFELASNTGGWQWAAGCGCDAAPYFRVFNPTSQQEKFDKQFTYVKKWVPEFGTKSYISPIIDHKFARERVLERYKQALKPA